MIQTEETEFTETPSSLGDTGIYVKTDKNSNEGILEVSIPKEKTLWHIPKTLQLARWNAEKEQFMTVESSRYFPESGVVRGSVSKGGVYGVFGISRIPHIQDLQKRLCLNKNIGRGGLGADKPRICQRILCRQYDYRAWSQTISEQSGMDVTVEQVQNQFRNVCDQCLDRGGGLGAGPECIGPGGGIDDWDDDIGDGDTYTPPVLEKMSVDIKWGGRAVASAVNPSNDDIIIVASETGGLFKSTDAGNNWTHVSDSTTFGYTDVQFIPGSSNIVIASASRDTKVSSGGGIYRSTDGGDSWSQVSINPPSTSCADDFSAYALDYESDQNRIYAGTRCGVIYSTDKGQSWSFLPATTNYNQPKTKDIETPASGNIKIVANNNVLVTTDGGINWSSSGSGLPSSVRSRGVLSQIEISPEDPNHIYWSFNYWDGEWRAGLWRSTDNGASWDSVYAKKDVYNRPTFLRIASSLSGNSNEYDIYFGNGASWLGRATATHSNSPTISSWNKLTVDHADVTGIAFKNDDKTPLLLTSDGGVHKTEDNGQSWTATGAGHNGYNALQITEVTGQQHGSDDGYDLYFGTQDNHIWGSPDSGINWPGHKCCEGFYINVPKKPLPDPDTRVTGVSCAGCSNYMADPVLTNKRSFPFSPKHPDEPFAYLAASNGVIRDSGGSVIGEAGTANIDHNWQQISFNQNYTNPVVIAQLMSYNGSDPSHTRLKNVGSNNFQVKIEEWGYLNGKHTTETIGYIVLEAGSHNLPAGGIVEANTVSANHLWDTVNFNTMFTNRPAVVSHSQTENGGNPIVTRQKNVGLGSTELRLQEEGGSDGSHVTETVGYIASLSSNEIEGRRSSQLVDEQWITQSFTGTYSSTPVVVAQTQGVNGEHTAGLRIKDVTTSNFELFVEDERSRVGNPKLIKPSYYLMSTRSNSQSVYHLSTNNGNSWNATYSFSDPIKGRPKLSGPTNSPTVFTAVRKPGTTAGGKEKVGIKRAAGVLGAGAPFVSEITGFGSLGTFPTMFAWYEPYAVDPDNPNTLIVPDIVSNQVKKTTNSGNSWSPINNLTNAVTGNGKFKFEWGSGGRAFVQVDVISYDPTCDDHIMVGTRQAGIFQSFDDGQSWEQVPGSGIIPRVSSFYYNGNDEAIVSSYGRGLWKVRYECGGSNAPPIYIDPDLLPDPILYWQGVETSLEDIAPSDCPKCKWLLVEEGDIRGYSSAEGRLRTLYIHGEEVKAYSNSGERVKVPVKVSRTDRTANYEDEHLNKLLEAGNKVSGVYLREGYIRGLIIAGEKERVSAEIIPKAQPERPHISLNISTSAGISLENARSLVITGHRFSPEYPVEIYIDENRIEHEKVEFTNKYTFTVEIHPELDIGPHTLKVIQETEQGEIVDLVNFNVTVSDEEESEDGKYE